MICYYQIGYCDILQMQGNRIYRYRKKYLDNYVIGKGEVNPQDPLTYTFYNQILVKYWLLWSFFIFLIDNYYINQCFFWPTFKAFYDYSLVHLIPLNLILMLVLLLHIIFKIMMTPPIPASNFQGLTPNSRRRLVIEHYLKYEHHGLFIGVYLFFALSFIIPYESAQYIHLVYLLRLIEMKVFLDIIYMKIYTLKFLRVFYNLTVMFYLILFFSHFLGCIFYAMDQRLIDSKYFGDPNVYPSRYYQYTSTSFTSIQSLSVLQKYIMAFYFSSGLVTTIAYGDIVGKNYIQDAYVTVLMVLSTITVAFILEEFMIMVEGNRFAIFEIIKKYKHLKQLMLQKDVPSQLQLKIRNYLFYAEYFNKFHNPEQVFSQLSEKLQIDLYENGYGPLFQPILSPLGITNIRELCQCFQQMTYQPETEIFIAEWKSSPYLEYQENKDDMLQDSILNPSLICIIKGKMLQYIQWQYGSKQFQVRSDQTHFNTFQFLTNRRVRYGLRSKTITQTISLQKAKFVEIIAENDALKKQLAIHREGVLCNSSPRDKVYDYCQVCGQLDHNLVDCPQAHYVISESIVQANKLGVILQQRVNLRHKKIRKMYNSKKQNGLMHFRTFFGGNFMNMFLPHPPQEQQKIHSLSLLGKSIKHMLQRVHQSSEQRCQIDCGYDPFGIDKKWSIED